MTTPKYPESSRLSGKSAWHSKRQRARVSPQGNVARLRASLLVSKNSLRTSYQKKIGRISPMLLLCFGTASWLIYALICWSLGTVPVILPNGTPLTGSTGGVYGTIGLSLISLLSAMVFRYLSENHLLRQRSLSKSPMYLRIWSNLLGLFSFRKRRKPHVS